MVNRFSELRNKEIIHVCEGTRLGYLNDLCIDTDTGRVTAIMVPGPCPVFGAVRQRLRLHHSLGLYPQNRRGYHPRRRTHSGLARAAQETRAVLRLAGRGKA